MSASERPSPLAAVLAITFLGSVSGGAFWTGTFFVTARHYEFSPQRNLALAAVMGAAYALTAALAGRLLRAIERQVSPRTVIALCLVTQALVACLPLWFPRSLGALWTSAIVGVIASAVLWPVVESYLSAGRHGARMRAAMGWFNVTWTPAVAIPLLVLPVVARWNVLWTLALSAPVNLLAVGALVWLPRRPALHGQEAAQASLGREYRWLMRSASFLLPLSYVMSATMSPVLPHRLAAIGVAEEVASPLAATWMVARFFTLAVMVRAGFWHGRWGTLALGAAGLLAGLALVLVAGAPGTLIVGLAIFGTGMGIIYYAAIYYTMAVGHASVDAGGAFEALIGLGYFVGPALGLVGQIGGGAGTTVALTWATAALVAWPTLRPYLEARRRRR